MSLAASIDLLYGPPLDVLANCIRGFIIAKPGKDLIVADYSQIEARGVPWLAGEQASLDVFASGDDIYCHAAAPVFGHIVDKKLHPEKRQVGKVIILACGYQGSVGAFQSMARNYNVKIADSEALKAVKRWRAANPNVVKYWSDVEDAAIMAIKHPGEQFSAGPIGRQVKFLKRGSFLFVLMPSGGALSYPYPKLVSYVWISRGSDKDDDRQSRRIPMLELQRYLKAGWKLNGEPGPGIHYKYAEPDTKQWVEGPTYGGALVQNFTEKICRDLLAEGMQRLEAFDYPIVMHTHDEAVAEVPEGFGSVEEYCEIFAMVPPWAQGMPIEAKGWRGKRYRKD